jgi:PKD repeat protein
MNTKKWLLSIFLIASRLIFGQTTYQNSYTQVLSLDTCGTFKVTSTIGFNIGDKAILIQMKGATMNETNTGAFGSIIDIASAGYYEIITIDTIFANTIVSAFKPINKYNFSGLVQLVSFKYYPTLTIDQDISPTAWNGRTGGILAINAGVLNINANISANGKGFRGGASSIPSNNCNGLSDNDAMFYTYNSWRSASKGEGVVESINNKEFGRGSQSNGGGGGNDHNAGGGGGGLFTTGGNGGINTENGLFNCKGKYPGIGGKPIPNNTSRIYLGGGGGAGHANNGLTTAGANGGGIVIITANQINYTNGKITANGSSATLADGDGGGGGGSAGMIVLVTNNINSNIPIEAIGGAGADVINNGPRCIGPGGGGSGGVIISTSTINNTSIKGASNGLSTNGICGPNNNNDATPGQDGFLFTLPNFKILESNSLPVLKIPLVTNTSSDTVCNGAKAYFNISIQGPSSPLSFQWYVNQGNGYIPLVDDTSYIGSKRSFLEIVKYNAAFANYTYKCIITASCGALNKTLTVLPFYFKIGVKPKANFDYTITGNTINFVNMSTNYNSITWDLGNGNTSDQSNITATYSINDINVRLIAKGSCGNDTIFKNIKFGAAPIPTILNTPVNGCTPTSVKYQATAINNPTTWSWKFQGGLPSTSTDQNPTINYFQAGTFDVELTVTNSISSNTIIKNGLVTINSIPTPNFDFILSGKTVTISNKTIGGSNYLWNFGDGTTSTEVNPIHTYAKSGDYNITLLINKSGCSTSITKSVVIRISSVENFEELNVKIYPNPFENILNIELKENTFESLDIYNILGVKILKKNIDKNENYISIEKELISGIYLIKLNGKLSKNTISKSIIKI